MLKNKLIIALACVSLFVLTTGCINNQEPEQVDEPQVESPVAPTVEEEEATTEESAETEEEVMDEEETEAPVE